jgi:Fe-S-cluster containining protein
VCPLAARTGPPRAHRRRGGSAPRDPGGRAPASTDPPARWPRGRDRAGIPSGAWNACERTSGPGSPSRRRSAPWRCPPRPAAASRVRTRVWTSTMSAWRDRPRARRNRTAPSSTIAASRPAGVALAVKQSVRRPAAKIISPPDQRFECRDCPARCCRLPWRVGLEPEEVDRYLADPWVRERAGDEGVPILERGVLPMREHDRKLQCVFLDDDGLQHAEAVSHAAIPRSCQAFPFGFVRGEDGVLDRAALAPLPLHPRQLRKAGGRAARGRSAEGTPGAWRTPSRRWAAPSCRGRNTCAS